MYSKQPFFEVTISEENSEIVNGTLKKFTYDNSQSINCGITDYGIIIPDGITGIDTMAFEERFEIRSIYIGKDVKWIDHKAFLGCENLISLEVSPENTELHSKNNCIINTAQRKLIIGCVTSIIPNDGSVTQIGNAFYECKKLNEIVVPEGVICIAEEAFRGCERLKKVYLPKSLKYIGEGAFSGCIEKDAFDDLQAPVDIYYEGTSDDWFSIQGGSGVLAMNIFCTDKTV